MMKRVLFAMLYIWLGGLITLVLLFAIQMKDGADLKPWHEVHLDAEFSADSSISDLQGYLDVEKRLFRQLEEQVLRRLPQTERGPINRYHSGSLTDPERWDQNWNRTFELKTKKPIAGVLLLHGMSDSPYSLRSLGRCLNEKGAWVLGLRLPGHGAIPSGLVRITWEDMASAVRIAMRHMRQKAGDKPLFIIGYSTGGALAVEYALEQIEGKENQPQVDRIVLISPAIGVTPMAAFAVWQARIGRLLSIDKLLWQSIQPEYNAYKYSSFAINAGTQVFRLAAAIRKRLERAKKTGKLTRFPPVLTFQSVADDTVSTPAVFTGLYRYLANAENELVVFDINRRAGIDSLLASDPLERIQAFMKPAGADFELTLVTNENASSHRVAAIEYEEGVPVSTPPPLDLNWPEGVHSLSHIALPFPEDDPLYGNADSSANPGISLGGIVLLGERGVISIPANEILRLRWNPFYPYLKQRVMAFLAF